MNCLMRVDDVASRRLPSEVRHLWRNFLRRAKNLLGLDPVFLPVLLRLTPLGTSRQITPSTDLVIEGFPRSGNTFTAFAVDDASGHQLTIASHVHQPSQIKLALARGVPTVLVVRAPVAALASYLVYDPRFSASTVIGEYCSYHRQLVPYAERLLVCEFDEVTSHTCSVIDRINHRYSLRIGPFDEEPSHVDQVFAQIEWRHKLVHPGLDPVPSAASPQSDRRKVNEQMREALLHPRNAAQMAEAQELFRFFSCVASRQRESNSGRDSVGKRSARVSSNNVSGAAVQRERSGHRRSTT
jgi:hypothetical protein